MSNPARTLAKGRRTANWLAIALAASVLFNIATPVYYSLQSKTKDKLVVFDLASGSLLLSPLVDPGNSKDILDISASWAAKAILDRSPAGLDNDELVVFFLITPPPPRPVERSGTNLLFSKRSMSRRACGPMSKSKASTRRASETASSKQRFPARSS